MKLLPIPRENLISYIKEHAGEKSSYEMAKDLGVNVTSVYNSASKHGISLVMKGKVDKREALRKCIRENYKTMTISEIAEKFKVSWQTVYGHAHRMGVEFEGRKLKAKVVQMSEYFNEGECKNWLTGWR